MLNTVLAAAAAFLSTNLDDILILTLLFAQTRGGRGAIAAGQFAGIGALTAVGFLCARLAQGLPESVLALLGLVPMALGVRAWFQYRRADQQETLPDAVGFLPTALLTVANGGDNLGVYIPLFAGYSLPQMAVTAAVFALLTALWCLLGAKLAALPGLRAAVLRRRRVIVPAVLVLLGLYILLQHTIL